MNKRILLAITALLMSSLPVLADPPLEEGKAIFTSRCAACHNINKTVTGPALAGVTDRRSPEWIAGFIRSSQTMIKEGDKDAITLFEQFNKIPMPDHSDLSDNDIDNILSYIKAESKTEEAGAPFKKPGKIRPQWVPLSIYNYGFFTGFFAVVAMMIAAMLLAVKVRDMKNSSSS